MDKMSLIQEILEHLSGHQAKGLKDLLDKSREPKDMPKEVPKLESVEIGVVKPKEEPFDKKVDDSIEDHTKPEMDNKPGEEMGKEDEMSDEELATLIQRLC